MSVKSALRKMSRAFRSQDHATFDEGIEELEESLEKDAELEEPETIEVHNHMPGSDTALGEIPPKDSARDSEEPEWFKKHREQSEKDMKSMRDSVEALQKWAKEEGKEPEHSEDRHRDRRDEEGREDEFEEPRDDDPNLEMDRHRDRHRDEDLEEDRHRDRRNDGRNRDRHSDEANREILGELEFEAPPGTGDKARKARDSQYLEDAFSDAASKAEILAPGIRLPTFDHKAPPVRTLRAINTLRKTALDLAYNQAETRGYISDAMSGRTLDSRRMSFASTRVLFNSVASAAAQGNNRRATDRSAAGVGQPVTGARIQSLADINRINREAKKR